MVNADAGVVKLVDTSDSKSDGCIIRIGSIPIAGNLVTDSLLCREFFYASEARFDRTQPCQSLFLAHLPYPLL